MISLFVKIPLKEGKAGEFTEAFKEIATAFIDSIWAFLFPVLLIGGIRFGFFTPAEAGAFATLRP